MLRAATGASATAAVRAVSEGGSLRFGGAERLAPGHRWRRGRGIRFSEHEVRHRPDRLPCRRDDSLLHTTNRPFQERTHDEQDEESTQQLVSTHRRTQAESDPDRQDEEPIGDQPEPTPSGRGGVVATISSNTRSTATEPAQATRASAPPTAHQATSTQPTTATFHHSPTLRIQPELTEDGSARQATASVRPRGSRKVERLPGLLWTNSSSTLSKWSASGPSPTRVWSRHCRSRRPQSGAEALIAGTGRNRHPITLNRAGRSPTSRRLSTSMKKASAEIKLDLSLDLRIPSLASTC